MKGIQYKRLVLRDADNAGYDARVDNAVRTRLICYPIIRASSTVRMEQPGARARICKKRVPSST